MSNDSLQLVDEISSSSKEMDDEWVLEIGARLDNQVISDPTKPLKKEQDSYRDWPSIFGSWDSWDEFGVNFLPETTKWQFVAYMKRWFGLDIRSYHAHIREKEGQVWSYYEGVNELLRTEKSKCFIEHLLVNSCFLIFAMVILSNKSYLLKNLGRIVDLSNYPKDERSIEFDNLSHLFRIGEPMQTQQYMLNLDYQIPWFVVKAVYTKHSNLNTLLDTPIDKLALLCFDNFYPGMHTSKVHHDTITLPPGGFKHLLHIFHWSRSPKDKFLVESESWPPKRMDSFYIPSATDMQLSETVFEKHADGSIDVSYCERRLSGVMQLAPLHLFRYSIKIFESLLRFEQLYHYCGHPFTAYVACMVCLLQTEADVRLLRKKGIVPSTRNNEKDVLSYVQGFKSLLDDSIVMSGDLEILSANVMERHARKPTRYYGEFKNRYCANPWITISVIAAILLFVLTFIQTIYGTLSYYKQ